MKHFLLLSLLAVALLGVTSCGGNRTKNEGVDIISSMLKQAINEAKSRDDSLKATEDTLDRADSVAVKKVMPKARSLLLISLQPGADLARQWLLQWKRWNKNIATR
jgi:hypothetical protein